MYKKDVYAHFGGCTKVAIALSLSTASVASWGELVPRLRAYQIQVLTHNKLTVDPSLYA